MMKEDDAMAGKVTLRIEDLNNQDQVSYSGPISIYKTVDTVDLLNDIPDEEGFPVAPETSDGEFDTDLLPNVVVYVKNVTGYEPNSLQYRGAYFRYNYLTASWTQILLGTHTHENKDIIDKIAVGNVGEWNDITALTSTKIGTDFPTAVLNDLYYNASTGFLYRYTNTLDWSELGYTSGSLAPTSTNANIGDLYFATTPQRLYKYTQQGWTIIAVENVSIGTLSPESPVANLYFYDTADIKLYQFNRWSRILEIRTTSANPDYPKIGEYYFNTTLSKLFKYVLAIPSTERMLTLEVTDPDEFPGSYSYEVKWQDLPKSLPNVPTTGENDTPAENLYLGLDQSGNPTWKNEFIAAQTFQFKQIEIVTSGNNDYRQLGPTNFITIPDVFFDSAHDEVLVLDNSLFVFDKTIEYNPSLRVLRVTVGYQFEVGNKISVLIIRNGAASILDQLAVDYISKDEALNILSGGSIKLRNYATKAELAKKADKYHTHSQFAPYNHDHDFKYADLHHTHDQYLTRRKTLELIQEVLTTDGTTILETLQSISDYLVENSPELSTLATKTDIDELQEQIDTINENYYSISQLNSYLDTRKFNSTQIDVVMNTGDTEFDNQFKTPEGAPRDLTDILSEMKADIDRDLGSLKTSEVLLDEEIQVLIGQGEKVGGLLNGETVGEGTDPEHPTITLNQVLKSLLQREIPPVYEEGYINSNIISPEYPEVGSTFPISIVTEYMQEDSGMLNSYQIKKREEGSPSAITLLSATSLQSSFSDSITVGTVPIIVSVQAGYADGDVKLTNFNNPYPTGRILAGTTNTVEKTIQPVRAVFYGAIDNNATVNSSVVRGLNKYTSGSYESFYLTYSVSTTSRKVIFALPVSAGELSAIYYKEQGNVDVIDLFETSTVSVFGAGSIAAIDYRVYTYTIPLTLSSKMTFQFKK
jgi:hypothetical protein